MTSMNEDARRKLASVSRIEDAIGQPVHWSQRGPVHLPSGRRAFLIFARGHARHSDITYWFGIPLRASESDLAVLLLGEHDFVVPVRQLTEAAEHMTRSADGRLTPYVVESAGAFEHRVPDIGLASSLDAYRSAYEQCR